MILLLLLSDLGSKSQNERERVFSISSAPWMAICIIKRSGRRPYQCSWLGETRRLSAWTGVVDRTAALRGNRAA